MDRLRQSDLRLPPAFVGDRYKLRTFEDFAPLTLSMLLPRSFRRTTLTTKWIRITGNPSADSLNALSRLLPRDKRASLNRSKWLAEWINQESSGEFDVELSWAKLELAEVKERN